MPLDTEAKSRIVNDVVHIVRHRAGAGIVESLKESLERPIFDNDLMGDSREVGELLSGIVAAAEGVLESGPGESGSMDG